MFFQVVIIIIIIFKVFIYKVCGAKDSCCFQTSNIFYTLMRTVFTNWIGKGLKSEIYNSRSLETEMRTRT